MLIDFHCHTRKVKVGDKKTREVSKEKFREKILEAGVEIVAITNHNLFDVDQYRDFKESVESFCEVWPGVELDVIGPTNKVGHVIVICNPTQIDDFACVVNDIFKDKDANIFSISIDDMLSAFALNDVVYIAHYCKNKELPYDDLIYFESIIDDKRRLLKEPSDLTTIGVLHCLNQRAVIGSDVQIWDEYEKSHFGELKFPIRGFNNFIKFLEKDTDIINDLIQGEFEENIKVYGNQSKKENPFIIPIFKDVNIIFGDKGSGKSEILKSLNDYYITEKSIIPVYYEGGEKDNWFKKILEVDANQYDYSLISTSDCKNEIKEMIQFLDIVPTPLSNYRDYFMHESRNKKKKKMKILTISKNHSFDLTKLDKLQKEYKSISDFLKTFPSFEIAIKYPEKQNEIIEQLEFLKNENYKLMLGEWIEQQSNKLIDSTIVKLNRYVAECVGAPVLPTETGLSAFAKKRISLELNAKKVLNVLNEDIMEIPKKYIGNIGDKGQGFIKELVGFINLENYEKYKEYILIKGMKTTLKNFIVYCDELKNSFLDLSVKDKIDKFSELCSDKKIENIESFMFVKKEFYLSDKAYNPSKGEKAILALQFELLKKQEEAIFLIDEPELSLGSVYIEQNIVPLVKSLGASKKIVVIATHDGNISVRSRPVNSILKLCSNDIYTTYVGSMFTNELVNIEKSNDKLSWKEQSIKYLEGGIEAYEERGYLYE